MCFCSVPVTLRGAYAREMAAILADGGLWLGLVFPMRQVRPPRAEGASGPPFVVRREDLDAAFGSQFEFVADFDAVGSVPLRAGAERWFVWRRRPRA